MGKSRYNKLVNSVKSTPVGASPGCHVAGVLCGFGEFSDLNNTFTAYNAPTNNCQLWSIASFCNVLDGVETKEEFLDALKVIWNKGHSGRKPLLLVDIPTPAHERLVEWWPKTKFKINEHYRSSNNSHMWLCLLDLRGVIFHKDTREVLHDEN